MKSPKYFFFRFFQIVEHQLQITVVTVQIVQMNYIRIERFDMGEKSFCRETRLKTIVSRHSGFQSSYFQFTPIHVFHRVCGIAFSFRIKNFVFDVFLRQKPAYRHGYLPGASLSACHIYLRDFHFLLPEKVIRNSSQLAKSIMEHVINGNSGIPQAGTFPQTQRL